jgi:hypothetical protein
MAKDREGRYHPPKGKPSSIGKPKAAELHVHHIDHIEKDFEITDRYTKGETEEAYQLRHPNRDIHKARVEKSGAASKTGNTENKVKAEETFEAKENDEEALPPSVEELPGTLSKKIFEELASFSASCCISIYLPTHKAGAEVNEQMDALAFKNILQKVSGVLQDQQMPADEIEKILEPAHALLRNENFWRKLSNGLAVFIADGFFKFIKMPIAPKEDVLINSSFYIGQLIPLLANKAHFYLLVISKKQAKLFYADAFGMQYLNIPEMPNGVDDVVHLEEKDDQKLWRTGSSGDGGGANYHGIGAGKPDDKANLALYLQEVDNTTWKAVLHNENVPLLLAGVEYLIPIYRQVAKYKSIWNEALTGSHEHDDTNTLFQQALGKMQPYFQERTHKALDSYGDQSASALTSSVPDDVIPAAYYGKVAHLFIQEGEHLWGKFNEQTDTLVLHETEEPNDDCLLDKASIKTILNGGEVHILPKEKMPADSKVAALMRY